MNNLIKTTSQALMQQLQIDFEQPFTAYTPQPGTTEFSFSWPVEDGKFIMVYKNNLPLIYETDYLVSLNPSPLLGGLVTLVNATILDDQIVVTRDSVAQRISSYTQNGFFSATTLNNDINFLIMLIQELKLQMSRTIKLPSYTIDTSGLMLPSRTARANSILGFDAQGDVTMLPLADQNQRPILKKDVFPSTIVPLVYGNGADPIVNKGSMAEVRGYPGFDMITYDRDGRYLIITIAYRQTGPATAQTTRLLNAATNYLILPGGLQIDETKCRRDSVAFDNTLEFRNSLRDAVTNTKQTIRYELLPMVSSNLIYFYMAQDSMPSALGFYPIFGDKANDRDGFSTSVSFILPGMSDLSGSFRVPIVGWKDYEVVPITISEGDINVVENEIYRK